MLVIYLVLISGGCGRGLRRGVGERSDSRDCCESSVEQLAEDVGLGLSHLRTVIGQQSVPLKVWPLVGT